MKSHLSLFIARVRFCQYNYRTRAIACDTINTKARLLLHSLALLIHIFLSIFLTPPLTYVFMSNPTLYGVPDPDKISETPVFMRVSGFCPIISQASIRLTIPVAFILETPFRAKYCQAKAGGPQPSPIPNGPRRFSWFLHPSICTFWGFILFSGGGVSPRRKDACGHSCHMAARPGSL